MAGASLNSRKSIERVVSVFLIFIRPQNRKARQVAGLSDPI
jgi:hypothetical protein